MTDNIYQQHADKVVHVARSLAQHKLSMGELLFDASFILNFIVGKLIHVLSQQEEVYNYYNNKGNVFNQWFVKKGWGWTTFVIILFYAFQITKAPGQKHKVATGAVIRWAVATFWWVLFTQWCFGLPLMDKVFVFTGGKCATIPAARVAALSDLRNSISTQFLAVGDFYESKSVSSYACRKLKGSWEGGHDPSGHVFLLVHSSLYLFHEIRSFWPGWSVFFSHIHVLKSECQDNVTHRTSRLLHNAPYLPVMLLLSLWWFMLLVTNMYFHSLSEKLVGLVFGYLGVFAVYYAPRFMEKKKNA